MSRKTYLLDTSFLIALEEEAASNTEGPATRVLISLGKAPLFITPVSVAELLEGAENELETQRVLSQFKGTSIGWHPAVRCALNQSREPGRRMGENDAWQAALAVDGDHVLIGHDHAFERRAWLKYLDFAKG